VERLGDVAGGNKPFHLGEQTGTGQIKPITQLGARDRTLVPQQTQQAQVGSINDMHGHLRPFTPPKRDGVTPVTLGPFRRASPYLLDDPHKLLSPDSKVTAAGGQMITQVLTLASYLGMGDGPSC
jgi:hypothetical protein